MPPGGLRVAVGAEAGAHVSDESSWPPSRGVPLDGDMASGMRSAREVSCMAVCLWRRPGECRCCVGEAPRWVALKARGCDLRAVTALDRGGPYTLDGALRSHTTSEWGFWSIHAGYMLGVTLSILYLQGQKHAGNLHPNSEPCAPVGPLPLAVTARVQALAASSTSPPPA